MERSRARESVAGGVVVAGRVEPAMTGAAVLKAASADAARRPIRVQYPTPKRPMAQVLLGHTRSGVTLLAW